MACHYGRYVARHRGDIGNGHNYRLTLWIGSGEITTDHGYIIRTSDVSRAGDGGRTVDGSHGEGARSS